MRFSHSLNYFFIQKILAGFLLVFWLNSCSLDYSQGQSARSLNEQTPKLIINAIDYERIRLNQLSLHIKAKKIELFTSKKLAILYEVEFEEYQSQGTLNTRGTVEKTQVNTDSENASVDGLLYVYSQEQDAQLWTSELEWEKDSKILSAQKETLVQISQKNGFKAQGRGFHANLKENTFAFHSSIDGLYDETEEEEEQQELIPN